MNETINQYIFDKYPRYNISNNSIFENSNLDGELIGYVVIVKLSYKDDRGNGSMQCMESISFKELEKYMKSKRNNKIDGILD